MNWTAIRCIALIIILAMASISQIAIGQSKFVFWPDADYVPGIPTFKSVLVYEPGVRITCTMLIRKG